MNTNLKGNFLAIFFFSFLFKGYSQSKGSEILFFKTDICCVDCFKKLSESINLKNSKLLFLVISDTKSNFYFIETSLKSKYTKLQEFQFKRITNKNKYMKEYPIEKSPCLIIKNGKNRIEYWPYERIFYGDNINDTLIKILE